MAEASWRNTVAWTAEDQTFWDAEVTRSRAKREAILAQWGVVDNLQRYTPITVKIGNDVDMRVNVAKDFSDVERKKAALFYNTPQIALVPDPGTDGSLLPLHEELINTLLSVKHMDAKATVLPTIQDCLVAIQPVPTEIGYQAVQVPMPQPVIDPQTGQPQIDPQTGQPVTQEVPVTVWEEFFWRRVSPKAQLLPVALTDTCYDRAAWLGFEWRKPVAQVRRQFGLPDSWTGGSAGPDRPTFRTTGGVEDDSEPMCAGVKLWYRASVRDPQVTHPDVVRELERVEGWDTPVVHRDCPYQTIGPDGRLTANSMRGYPDHPLALRDLTDAAYVASDCTLTGPLTRELNKFRTQMIERRDGSRLHVLFDSDRINPEVRQKIEQGDIPKLIPVVPGALEGGIGAIMQQVPALALGRENYLGQDIIERDRDGILGLSANTMNPGSSGGKTATEVQTVQRNTDARFEQERQRVLDWWLRGVEKISALVLRYGDRLAQEILGAQRGQQWVQARDAGQFGPFAFEVVIDSGAYIDVEARKRQDLQLYNLTAKDPTLRRGVVQARLATDFGLNPAEWIVTEAPQSHPDPPQVSIAVRPEDLDPLLPSYAGTYAILTAGGVQGLQKPQQPQAPPPGMPPGGPMAPHGGMAEPAGRLDQRQLTETGQNSGGAVGD